MLERLHLTGWQKHSDLEVEFGPITSICGPSNAGKSSVLRALKWAMTNKPSGSKFIKRGEKECRVEVAIDGRMVVRERGRDNCYLLDGTRYEALAGGVPDDVVRVFDVGECNYQSQAEGTLYWFALSDGEVAKELNKVVDLSLIDSVMKSINSKVRKQEQELDGARTKWEQAKISVASLDWVENAAEAIAAIEALRLVSQEKRERLTALRLLIGEIEELQSSTADAVPERELVELEELFIRRREVIEQRRSLLRLVEQIEEAEREIERLTEEWRAETKALRDQMGDVCPTCRRSL